VTRPGFEDEIVVPVDLIVEATRSDSYKVLTPFEACATLEANPAHGALRGFSHDNYPTGTCSLHE